MKLIVLAQDGPSTWMLVNALRQEYADLQVGIEDSESSYLMMRRRVRRKGVWPVLGQILFIFLVRYICRSGLARKEQLSAASGLDPQRPKDLSFRRFNSANTPDCQAWLREERPDVVVINGTRILSNELLRSSQALVLNIHCGITPAYRGVHGAYWALYRNDPGNAGVTVHVVDAGIDTGDIVYQETIQLDGQDNFLTYPVKQYISGITLMKKALRDVSAGQLRTSARDDLPSAIWQHPTIWQYLRARWSRGVR